MRRAQTGTAPHPGELILFVLLGGLGALALFVWLWGGAAGALFGRGWPALSAGALLGVVARLPQHLSRPAGAWPSPARQLLPGTLALWGSCVLIGAPSTGLVAVIARHTSLRRGGGGARWAARSDLRPLRRAAHAHGQRAGRLALGTHRGRLLYAEQRHALVAFGPPQSGKSAGLAIPALLEWEGPAIASSIKTDLLSATLRRRRQLGEALIFDPFALSGVTSHTWSPIGQAGTWDGALEVAWRMTSAGELDHRGVDGGDFWAVAAEQRLAPLFYAAARSGRQMNHVVAWVYGQGSRELDDALDEAGRAARNEPERADARAAYEAVRAFRAQADRTRSSIEATAQALLRAYRFTRVARSAAGGEITADRLLDTPSTLYLVGDAKASKLLRPIFLALLSEVIDRAYERANQAGGRLDQPLLVCLDEAGNVAPLPNLAEIATTAPSHNIQLISIFHDIAQAKNRYGQQAETVINSHRARMLLPGVADLETLRYFSGLLGEEETRDLTRTTGAGGATRSVAQRRRPLLAAEALRQLPDWHALLLYGRLPPAQVRLRRWFGDRRLRALAAGGRDEPNLHDPATRR